MELASARCLSLVASLLSWRFRRKDASSIVEVHPLKLLLHILCRRVAAAQGWHHESAS